MEERNLTEAHQNEIICCNCKAKLTFSPGTMSLKCEYCGTMNQIEVKQEAVREAIKEIDFEAFIRQKANTAPTQKIVTIQCDACKATTTFDPNVVSSSCDFCGSPLIAKNSKTEDIIEPKALLPFNIDHKQATDKFQQWLSGLWFAPSKLKDYARTGKLSGIYTPYWTYDADTVSQYQGEQGIDYEETEEYTDSDGKRQTRTVTKTNWYHASGTVRRFFDDILVVASQSLPVGYVDGLAPWDLNNLVPYDPKFLSGFKTERYQVDLKDGFDIAKDKMKPVIENDVRKDIGGDRQRIHSLDTACYDITFKHVLLPIWLSAYKYNEKTYRFLVNARTGKVQGERPYSAIKIILFILVIVAIIATLVVLFKK